MVCYFGPLAVAATLEEQVGALFRPITAEEIVLAPDGRHVAYTQTFKQDLAIIIMDVDAPDKKTTIVVDDAQPISGTDEKEPARLRFLKWATANRLVFAPKVKKVGRIIVAPLQAVDADGKNPTTLIDARELAVPVGTHVMVDLAAGQSPAAQFRYRPPNPIAFVAGDRDNLLIEAEGMLEGGSVPVVHDTELIRVNVQTGKFSVVSVDNPFGSYRYDWQGRRRINYLSATNIKDRVFEYQPATEKHHWTSLGKALPGWKEQDFRLTAENYFRERNIPLGFDFNANCLFVASNVGRDTFDVQAVNLTTGARTSLGLTAPHADIVDIEPAFPSRTLVFDEYKQQLAGVRLEGARHVAVWKDHEVAALQKQMDARFPDSTVDILDWTPDHARFLLRITSASNPGGCFIYFRDRKELRQISRRAPWITRDMTHESEPFEFTSPEGTYLSGYLTMPRSPRLAVPPVVVVFAAEFPAVPHREFDPEAHVLAGMGFAVLRLNQRGTVGLGREHLTAISRGVDRVAAEDAVAALEWLAARHKVDRKRVALLGQSFGGYLAVRTLQLKPEVFRCAVAMDSPLDPEQWLDVDTAVLARRIGSAARRALLEQGAKRLGDISVLNQPELITKPVCLFVSEKAPVGISQANDALISRLTSLHRVAERIEVGQAWGLGLPAARARGYRQLEEFFNANLYDFDVKVGPTKVVK